MEVTIISVSTLAYLGVHMEAYCKEYKHQIPVGMIYLSIYMKFTESFEVVINVPDKNVFASWWNRGRSLKCSLGTTNLDNLIPALFHG